MLRCSFAPAQTRPFLAFLFVLAALFIAALGVGPASAQSVQSCTVPPGGPAPGANMCGDTHTWSSVQPGQTISGTMSWKGLAPAVILNGGSDVPGFNVDGGQVYGPVNYSWTIPAGTATGTYRATVHVEYGDFSCGLYGTCPLGTPGYVIVQVSNAPPAPTVNDVNASTGHNQAVSIAASTNGSVSSLNVGTAANGTVGVAGFQMVYTPRSGFYGQDQFAYSANGPGGRSPDATVRVNVAPPAPPTASNGSVNASYNTQTSSFRVNVGGTWNYEYNNVEILSGPSRGSLTGAGYEWFTYRPNNGWIGADSFTYRVTGPGGASNAATMTVTTSPPPAPTAGNMTQSFAYQTGKQFSVPASGVADTISVTSLPSNGSAEWFYPTITYTPKAGFYGTDTLRYRVNGPGGSSPEYTVTLNVSPPPAPTAANTTMTASYNGGEVSRALPIGGVATEAQGVTPPSNGTYGFYGTTGYYTPRAGFYGTDSFTYRAVGPGGNSAPATVTVTVTPPAAPSVANRSVSTAYNTSVSAATGVSGVYSSLGITAFPANGNASIVGTDIVYAPNAGFIGTNTIQFRAEGPGGFSNTGTITVTVNAPPAPTSSNATISTGYNTAVEHQPTLNGVAGGTNTIASPNNGGLAKIGNGWRYTPNAGYYGTDRWTFSVVGPGGTSPVYTVTVNVGVPPAPDAGNVTASTAYQTPVDVALTPTGVYSSVVMGSAPANGSASITGTTARYTPAAGFYGTDSFIYRAIGPGGNSATRTVTVTVAAPPAPSVSDVAASTAYNTPVVVQAAISGVGAVSNTGHGASGQTREGGTVSFAGNAMTFTPRAGFYGTDVFHYFATGPGGQSATFGVVTVTVGTPPAPAANNLSASTAYESPVAITLTASGVVGSFAKVSDPTNGSVSVSGSTATYTPAPGFYGTNTFTYTATGPGGTSAPATVTVTVNVPPPPTAADTSLSVAFQTVGTRVLPVAGVLTTVAVVDQPAHGSASITGTTLTYTPATGFHGADSLTYRATGPGGSSQTRTVAITVATPAAPTITGRSLAVGYNAAASATLNVTGYQPVLSTGTAPSHGTVSYSGAQVTYTPTAGYFGADSFTVIATNAGGSSAPASITVTVANPPAPTLAPASVTTPYEAAGSAMLAPAGVWSSLRIVSQPAHGSASITGTTLTYTPAAAYYGADALTVEAIGPGGVSSPATVTVNVGLPGAPSVSAATLEVAYETAGELTAAVSGVHDSVEVATQPANGRASVSGGQVRYEPDAAFYGLDTFTIRAIGPGGTSDPATITVNVGLPAAPVAASALALSTPYETPGEVALAASGVFASFALVTQPQHGVAALSGDRVSYTPAAGYYGADSFTFRAVGPGGNSAPATVTVEVGLPAAPVAQDGAISTPYETVGSVNLRSSGVGSTFALVGQPANGTARISNGVASYTPNAGYFGADAFTFTVSGPGGTSAPATVSVMVGLPGKPVASPDSIETPYDTSGTVSLRATGVHDRFAIVANPAHGSVSLAGAVVTYTPSAGYYGADAFTFTAEGPGGLSNPATIAVTVALPSAPTVGAVAASTPYETAKAITLAPAGVYSSVAIGDAPAHGQVELNGLVATYTPAPGHYGADSFTYRATGPGGVSAVGTVTVTVGLPAAPTAEWQRVNIVYGQARTFTLGAAGVVTSLELVDQPRQGTVSLNGRDVTYTPNASYFGADFFTFRAVGPGGNSAKATVDLVVGLPPAPTGEDATLAVDYETGGSLELPADGVIQRVFITQGQHGTVAVTGKTATYTPRLGFYGEDTFTYRVSGPGGDSAWFTVRVTVGLPPAPTVTDTTLSTAFQTAKAVVLPAQGVLTTVNVVQAPAHGTTSITGTTLTYTPAAGYHGPDELTFSATGPGGTSNIGKLTITVGLPNTPVINNLTLNTRYEQAVSGSFVVTGFSPVLAVASSPANGSVEVAGRNVTYTPAAGFFGQDTFTVTAQNAGGVSAPATVTVNVAVPPAPGLPAASLTTPYEQAGAVELSPTGVYTAIEIVSQPMRGDATVSGRTVTFTPDAGFFGADTMRVRAVGPGGNSPTITVAITVGLPGAPSVSAATLTTAYETAGSVGLVGTGVFDRFQIVATPTNGNAVLDGATLRYTPRAGYFGADTLTVAAVGPGGTSAPATISVTVGLPSAPTAAPVGLATPYETQGQATLSGAGVFDGFALVAPPAHGAAVIDGAVVRYTPDAGYFGADSFTYRATGPGGVSAPAAVTVQVGLPGEPVALGGLLETPFETVGTVVLNASGVHDAYELVSEPTNGEVVLVGNEVRYTPAAGFFGDDAFTFAVRGPGGTSAPATITVKVGLPGKPVASPGSIQVPFDQTGEATLRATGVFDGFAITTQPTNGQVVIQDNKASYTPRAGFFGADAFAYVATGPGGVSNPAVIAVTVGLPDAPAVAAATLAVDYETPGEVSLSVSGVYSTVELAGDPANGVATLTGTALRYVPAARFFGADALTVRAIGPGGTSAVATVNITVGRPAVPVMDASDLTLTTAFETPVSATLEAAGVVDVFALASRPSNGSAALEGDRVTYTPAAGFHGVDRFAFVAEGPGGQSVARNIVVTVGVPAPVAKDLAATTDMDVAVTLELADAVAHANSAAIVAAPANGTVATEGTTATYTPAAAFFGVDTFTFTLAGPGGVSQPVTATVTVQGGPPPSANDDTKTGLSGEPIIFDVTEGMEGGPFMAVRLMTGGTTPQATHGGTLRVEGLRVIFTPAADWTGTTSFRFAVENRFGWSEPATLTAVVQPKPDTGAVIEAETWAGRPVDVSLTQNATGGPFLGADVVSITPNDAVDVVVTKTGDDYVLRATPRGQFHGRVDIQFTLRNAYATSAPGVVRLTVKERPDPSRDPEVTGLVNAQTQAAYRFSSAQMTNALRRLEQLHGQGPRRNHVGLTLVPMDQLDTIPGENEAMRNMRDYMMRAGMVEYGPNGQATPAEPEPRAAAGNSADGRMAWWMEGAVDLGFHRRNGVREGFDFTTDGVTVGADARVGDKLTVGAGAGYGRDSSDVGVNGTASEGEAYSGFLYASWQPRERVFVDGVLGMTSMSFDAQRYVTETGELLASEREGQQVFGALSAGLEFRGRRLHWSPYGRVEFADVKLGGFREVGDDLWALDFAEQNSSQVRAALGVHGDYLFSYRTGDLKPSFRVEYQHDLKNGGTAGVRYADWTDSPDYMIELAPYDDRNLRLGAGLAWEAIDGTRFGVEYESTVMNSTAQSGRWRVEFSKKF